MTRALDKTGAALTGLQVRILSAALLIGHVAQLAEHIPVTDEDAGSNPVVIALDETQRSLLFFSC